MTYMINARLEEGVPSLILADPITGEERLHWRGDSTANSEHDWISLFKRLVVLSCVDRIRIVQRAELPRFGNECIECTMCVNQETLMDAKKVNVPTETEQKR